MKSFTIDADGVLNWPHQGELHCTYNDAVRKIVAPAATYVDCQGCTGITSLDLPAATSVYCRGCTGITSLDLPAATYVYCRGCTGITSLDLPAATSVYCQGCTGLVPWFEPQLKDLFEGGGVPADMVVGKGWDCHSWDNCPMHVAYGVNGVERIPPKFRTRAAIFVSMFDSGMLKRPNFAAAT